MGERKVSEFNPLAGAENLGDFLKFIREREGLSLRAMGEAIGISFENLSRAENNHILYPKTYCLAVYRLLSDSERELMFRLISRAQDQATREEFAQAVKKKGKK